MAGRTIRQVMEWTTRADTRELDNVRNDIEATSRAIDEMGDEAEQVSRQSSDAEGGLSGLAKAAKIAATAMAGVAAVGVGVALAAVGQGARDFMAMSGAMNNFQAQTGIATENLDEYKAVAQEVFKAGFGDDFQGVVDAMSQVSRITGEQGEALEQTTKYALIMGEAFDAEVVESVRSADTIMENFGGTSKEAFDLLTTAMQQTGDPGQDLLDTFNEYSANFADMGFSAEEMFALMATGLEAGARNTDDLADGMREYQIRLKDGTSDLAMWRLGLDGVNAAYKRGEISAAEMFVQVQNELNAIEDPIERNALGIEIFGTKWEDAGEDAFLSMRLMTDGLVGMEGATDRAGDSLEKGLGPAWDRFQRTIRVGLANALEPLLTNVLEFLIPALEDLSEWVNNVGLPAFQAFVGVMVDIGTEIVEGLGGSETIINTLSGVVETLAGYVGDLAGFIGDLSPETIVLLGIALAVIAGPAILTGVLAIGGAIAGLVGSLLTTGLMLSPLVVVLGVIAAYETNFGGLKDKIGAVGDAIRNKDVAGAIRGIADALLAIPLGIATEIGDLIGIDVVGGLEGWEEAFDGLKITLEHYGSEAMDAIAQGIGDMSSWLLTELIAPLAAALLTADYGFILLTAGRAATELVRGIVMGLPQFSSWLAEHVIGPLMDAILNVNLIGIVITAARIGWDILKGIANVFLTLGSWVVNKILSPLITAILNLDLSGLLDTAMAIGTAILDGILAGLSTLGVMLIDLINEAIPDTIDFGTIDLGVKKIDLGSVSLPANPIPGGSRDTGGRGLPGYAYAINPGAGTEVFVPDQPGTFYAKQGGIQAGGQSININGEVHVHGVQNPEQFFKEMERIARHRAQGVRR